MPPVAGRGVTGIPTVNAVIQSTDPNIDPKTWEATAERLAAPFVRKWGVRPPPSVAVVDPDPRRPVVEALASGQWSLIPVFPWTRAPQITARLKAIQRVIGKRHRDATEAERVRVAAWLDACEYGWREIAIAVWGRREGLRRPTLAAAIEKLPEERETELLERFSTEGLSDEDARQRVYRRAQGSEAKASTMIRVAHLRYEKGVLKLNAALAVPLESERLSHSITMLLRADADGHDAERRQWIDEMRNILTLADLPRPEPSAQK